MKNQNHEFLILGVIRDQKMNMRHIMELGFEAQGTPISPDEFQRRYDSMCSYISQRQAISKNQEKILRAGFRKYIDNLTAELAWMDDDEDDGESEPEVQVSGASMAHPIARP